MKLTVEQAIQGFHAHPEDFYKALETQYVYLDENQMMDIMVAQALSRWISPEFKNLFGYHSDFLLGHIVFLDDINKDFFENHQSAAQNILNVSEFGISPYGTGREYIQLSTRDENIDYVLDNCIDNTTRYGVIIRDVNTSYDQALQDAYMLGCARMKAAIVSEKKEK